MTTLKTERSYASYRRVVLITAAELKNAIVNCNDWDDVSAVLSELMLDHAAERIGALTEYTGTDGKQHVHRWLDGCTIQPHQKRIMSPFFEAFVVSSRSGYKVAAVRHCVVG